MTESTSLVSHAAAEAPVEYISTISIWAVTLGVLSLLTLGLTAIPAVFCGYAALSDARKRRACLVEKRAAIAGLLAGCAGAALLVTLIATLVRA